MLMVLFRVVCWVGLVGNRGWQRFITPATQHTPTEAWTFYHEIQAKQGTLDHFPSSLAYNAVI